MIFKVFDNKRRFLHSTALVLAVVLAGGCDMQAPSKVSSDKVQVHQTDYFANVPISDVNDQYISALAYHFDKYGQAPLIMTVTYDPQNYRNTAMKANQTGTMLKGLLQAEGVRDVLVDILPVKGLGDEPHLVVSYDTYSAHAPDNCTTMPGIDGGRDLTIDPDYRLGCSIQTIMAKQISRPKDLMGQESSDTLTDGRASANIIEIYRTGAPNEPLEGESASGDNN